MFSTDRLVLRAYRDSDMEDLVALANDLEVQKYAWTEYIVPRSPNFQDTLRGRVNNSLFYGIISTKSTEEFVGNIAINQVSVKNREGSLAITISSKYWNQGYGSEALKFLLEHAFQSLALHRISLGVLSTNEKAIKLYKKCGFVEEGRLRKSVWVEGRWEDVILMSILEEEWGAK